MTEHRVTNTGRTRKTFKTDNGRRVSFAPGESKVLTSTPPDDSGWTIDELDDNDTTSDDA